MLNSAVTSNLERVSKSTLSGERALLGVLGEVRAEGRCWDPCQPLGTDLLFS